MKETVYIIVAAILVLVCLACIVNFSDFSGLQTPEPTSSKIYIGHEFNTEIRNYEDYLQYVNDKNNSLPDDFIHADALHIIGEFKIFGQKSSSNYTYFLSTEVGTLRISIVHDEETILDGSASLDMAIVGENMRTLTHKKKGIINRNGIFYSYNGSGMLELIGWKVDDISICWQSGSLEGTVLSGLLSLDDEEFQESVAVLTEAFGFVPSETPTPTTP